MSMQVKINNLPGYTPGTVVTVETDEKGTPLESFWRRRLKDAEIDQSVEVVKSSRSRKE